MKAIGPETYTDILALWRHGELLDPGSRLSQEDQARLFTAGSAIGPVIMTALPGARVEYRNEERFLAANECAGGEELVAAARRAGARIEPIRFERLNEEQLARVREALGSGSRSVQRLVDQTLGYCGLSDVRPRDCIANTGALYVVPQYGMIGTDTNQVMAALGLRRQQVIDGASIAAAS
jgi:hypothetical protein